MNEAVIVPLIIVGGIFSGFFFFFAGSTAFSKWMADEDIYLKIKHIMIFLKLPKLNSGNITIIICNSVDFFATFLFLILIFLYH